jgi:hypothetical protein
MIDGPGTESAAFLTHLTTKILTSVAPVRDSWLLFDSIVDRLVIIIMLAIFVLCPFSTF